MYQREEHQRVLSDRPNFGPNFRVKENEVVMYCENCVNAKKKFRKGDKVILSVEGCVNMPELILKKSFGRVVGFGRSFNLVRVLIYGLKYPQTFHAGFWERI